MSISTYSITALIVKKEKNRFGYTLSLFSPDKGFFMASVNISKKISVQLVQPFNLIEIDLETNSIKAKSIYPKVKDINLIFTFAPPYMEYLHFFSLQSLLLKIKQFFSTDNSTDNTKTFVMLSSFLKLSEQIKNEKESDKLLLSLFLKWNIILKVHIEILYCGQCDKKIMDKTSFASPLFKGSMKPLFICENCAQNSPIPLQPIDFELTEIWEMIYSPFMTIIKNPLSQKSLLFLDQYIKYYFYTSYIDLFYKKNNPFLDL